jgi:Ca2+:H+ antiporter
LRVLKWLSPLLVALPVALLGVLLGWRPLLIFVLAMIALIPLSAIIGSYTERLGQYYGEVASGLLDATFGNAPEIIIGILLILGIAPVPGTDQIIKALIIGSIVSNALFVLGTSIFVGALRNGRMVFSPDRAGSYASMLALAVAGLALPALAVFVGNGTVKLSKPDDQIHLSVVVAIVLLVSYAAYLAATIFNVGERGHPSRRAQREVHAGEAARRELKERNHERAQAGEPAAVGEPGVAVQGVATAAYAEPAAHGAADAPVLGDDHGGKPTEVERLEHAEEDDEDVARAKRRELRRSAGPRITGAIAVLAVATALVVVASVVLVSVMDDVIIHTANTAFPLRPFFVGFVILPFITNAVEQVGAITCSLENHMEEAMAIAAGSGVQMALLVAPVLLFASLALGHPLAQGLVFSKLELIIVTLVTFVYALVSLDGETTWLEGLQLIAFYVMVAAAAFFFPAS